MDIQRRQHYSQLLTLSNSLDATVRAGTRRRIENAQRVESAKDRLVAQKETLKHRIAEREKATEVALIELRDHLQEVAKEIRESATGVDHVADGDSNNRATIERLRHTADDLENTISRLID